MGRPLRFLLISTFYPPYHFGGDAIYVRRLAHGLARRGHAVDVIHDADAYRVVAGTDVREPAPPEPDGVRVHRLQGRWPRLACLATQQTGHPVAHGRTLRRLIAEIAPDVIHYHNISLVGGPGLLAYGDAVKLYTAHEHWLVCPTHILWRHCRELCDARECLRCQLRHGRPPQLWRHGTLLERKSREVDVFLAPSRFSADKHREFGFTSRMEVLPHFLPDSDEVPSSTDRGLTTPSVEPYFLFAGRLEAVKGVQDVIPLFDDDGPADLWIAGRGDHEPALRRLAEGRRRVRFLGHRSTAELRTLYANALALIAPSLCFEVFPMVLLEAFREGAPVIARRLGPYPEIVERSGAGLLFDSQHDLRAILARVTADQELRSRLGDAGRRALQTCWSEQVVLDSYLALVARVARERGREETRRIAEATG